MNTLIDLGRFDISDLTFMVRRNSSDEITIKENIKKHPITKHLNIIKGSNWIDCGAHIGAFSAFMQRSGANVYAVEPDPNHITMYIANMFANRLDFKLLPMAVMDAFSKRLPLYINYRGADKYLNDATNSMYGRWKTPRPKIMVDVIKLPALIDRAIEAFDSTELNLKLDIEGAEIPMLHSCDFGKFSQMYIKYHFDIEPSMSVALKAIALLQEQGFEVKCSHKLTENGYWKWYPSIMTLWCVKRGTDGTTTQ